MRKEVENDPFEENNLKYTKACEQCGKQYKEDSELKEHIQNQHPTKSQDRGNQFQEKMDSQEHEESHTSVEIDEEFNCEECDFQTNNSFQLQKHIRFKHEITCKFCGKQCKEKKELMQHRKSQHPSTVNQCSKYLAGKCFNSSEKCWWMHNDNTKEVILDKIECFICRKTFQSRREVVVHRKSVHVSFVRQCENFKKQNCRFNNESRWFLHGMKTLKSQILPRFFKRTR